LYIVLASSIFWLQTKKRYTQAKGQQNRKKVSIIGIKCRIITKHPAFIRTISQKQQLLHPDYAVLRGQNPPKKLDIPEKILLKKKRRCAQIHCAEKVEL
jgi:hypothetical protein